MNLSTEEKQQQQLSYSAWLIPNISEISTELCQDIFTVHVPVAHGALIGWFGGGGTFLWVGGQVCRGWGVYVCAWFWDCVCGGGMCVHDP